MPKAIVELEAEKNQATEEIEARYSDLSMQVCRALQKGGQIREAILSFEFKLQKAEREFDAELRAIQNNFDQPASDN